MNGRGSEAKSICVVTGTRAEFGQMTVLLEEIRRRPDLHLQLVATGAHLSKAHGYTLREIEEEGFEVERKVDLELDSDTPGDVARATGRGTTAFAGVLEELEPDALLVLGDRYEILAAATAALLLGVPLAHIHGGELTLGAVDDAIRHAVTKMAGLHFTATETYRQRVIQMGEHPARVHCTGMPGLDLLGRIDLPDRQELEEALGRPLLRQNLLITFHPVTRAPDRSEKELRALLEALDDLRETLLIFTRPNADAGGAALARMVDDYARSRPERACVYDSLGFRRYLGAMKIADAVVGNSSSGITEAPSMGTPSVDIGERQRGRVRAESVIHADGDSACIKEALSQALSAKIRDKARGVSNPYYREGASRRIADLLAGTDLAATLTKNFYDLELDDDRKAQ